MPLLRLEDVPLQTSASLFAAEREADGPLLDCIQRELAKRRVNALLFGDDEGGDEYEPSIPAAQEPPALLEAPTVTTSTTTAMVTAPVQSIVRPADRPVYSKSLLPPPAPLSPAPFTSFVTAQTNGAGGFKERARATARSRKMRALEQSEEHKQMLAEKQREERRQAIVRRMEERRERRQRAEAAREKKRQREQQRRAERARELEEEMERAAEIAKAEAESNGMSQEEAVASAAAAAASLIEEASCGIVGDSDSDDITTATSAESSAHASSDTDSPDRKVSPSTSVVGSAANANISPPSLYLCDDESSGTSESSEHRDDDDDEEEDGIKGEGARTNLQESLPTSSSSSSLSSSSQLDQPSSPEVDNISSGELLGEPSPASMSMDGDAPSIHTEDLAPDHSETLESSPATPSSPIPPPPASQRSFVSVYPHIWSLFTAFAQTNTASPLSPMASQSRKSKARPTEAIDALLKHQARINDEFLEAMEDYLELQTTSTVVSDDPPICPSSDRFVLINSGRPDVASLISDVLTTGYEGDDNDRVWHPMPTDLGLGDCFSFNLLWTWRQPQVDVQSLLLCQKINRFRGTRCLTRKDLLKKSIQKFSASARSSVSRIDLQGIMPLTFVLPQEYNAFAAAFSAIQRIPGASQSNLWISKPIGSSRGRGISVINDIGDVSYSQPIVIQKYLMNPLLFHGYKFDLRLYVLVTAFSRLEAFVYSEGLARFASKPFSASADCIYDEQIHLTNSSIQKDYKLQNSNPVRMAGTAGGDNKTRMTWLFRRLEGQGGIDTKLLWCQIKELCLKTLQVVDGNIPPQPNSFEIFGFDVIITDELKPLLIEVNACPALARDSHLDADVKEALIRDTVALVDPPTIDRRALSKICKQRMGGQSGGSTLEEDLRVIFTGRLPRQIGELPRELGGYEVLTVP